METDWHLTGSQTYIKKLFSIDLTALYFKAMQPICRVIKANQKNMAV